MKRLLLLSLILAACTPKKVTITHVVTKDSVSTVQHIATTVVEKVDTTVQTKPDSAQIVTYTNTAVPVNIDTTTAEGTHIVIKTDSLGKLTAKVIIPVKKIPIKIQRVTTKVEDVTKKEVKITDITTKKVERKRNYFGWFAFIVIVTALLGVGFWWFGVRKRRN